MVESKRIFLYHPDPWGNGVSCTFVYLPMWDGPLENYTKYGWAATYEDGTTATYNGECLIPFTQKKFESIRFEIIDYNKT